MDFFIPETPIPCQVVNQPSDLALLEETNMIIKETVSYIEEQRTQQVEIIDAIKVPEITEPNTQLELSCMDNSTFLDNLAMEESNVIMNVVNNDDLGEQTNDRRNYDSTIPFVGMELKSLEEADEFLRDFGRARGFSIRERVTHFFSGTKLPATRQYVCSCQGQVTKKIRENDADGSQPKQKRKTTTCRTGCKATWTVKFLKDESKWKFITVNNEHNHILVSPRSSKKLKCNRNMPSIARNLVEKFSESGLHIGRVPDILKGDGVNFSDRDCWNHMRTFRTLNLDKGDAEAVFQYCRKRQAQDPGFFYSIQTDDEGRMINFFWIDSTSQSYYERFGDVVVFDTTYKTNKYGMPFAIFVGVNHHLQSILFGCALLQDEQEKSFIWLFQTWLEAMHGKLPKTILTDQDRAIKNAIESCFPTIIHRFCLWHILKKFPEYFGAAYKAKTSFKTEMNKCLYGSITVEEFEKDWKSIMNKHNLQGNKWGESMFEIRQSWVPIYNRAIFFTGMHTTQRVESIHSFFDAFVNQKTTLREFVAKYEHALARR